MNQKRKIKKIEINRKVRIKKIDLLKKRLKAAEGKLRNISIYYK